MERGHVKLWRKSIDSGLLQNANLWTFWSWCLLKATWKNRECVINLQPVSLEPGQFIFGREAASKELKMSEQIIRTCVQKLKNMKNLTIKSTSRYSIITIMNWDIYQCNQPADNQQINQQVTSSQPAANHKQEVKEVKEGKEIKQSAKTENKTKNKSDQKPVAAGSLSADFKNQNKKHFSFRVGQSFERINTACEIIKNLEPKNGCDPINPYQWVQIQTNKHMHPGAIEECLRIVVTKWKEVKKGYYPYLNTLITKISPTYWEKENTQEAEGYKAILAELSSNSDILKRLGIDFSTIKNERNKK